MMMDIDSTQGIAVLGSTGSIGRQALEVASFLGIKINALAAAGNDIGLLRQQIVDFAPQVVAVADSKAADELARALSESGGAQGEGRGNRVEIVHGCGGVCAAAANSGAGTVVAAISGAAGLPAVISAIKAGKTIALANKETLVMAGKLVMELSREHSAPILPIDSEHSAVFQCLRGHEKCGVKRLIITASGGPFRGFDALSLGNVTPEMAAAHPMWNMGQKISIDSSTLANKGLEVIEASHLFGMRPEQIDVIIHPQCIVHSMVEFHDNSIIALMGAPDMRAPIQYALTYPHRRASLVKPVNFAELGTLTFENPDTAKFPCLALAYDALRAGGTMPAVYNAANEAAVKLFVDGDLRFNDIPVLIERAMEQNAKTKNNVDDMIIENIYAADLAARKSVQSPL